MKAGPARRAVAFAPSHITGLFRPSLEARDPRGRGSLGAGIVLAVGVRAVASLDRSGRSGLRLSSDLGHLLEISEEAASRLHRTGKGRLEIDVTHSLPVGQGYGSSAAGATAVALATARLLGRTRAEAVEVAHLADLFGRGGLGGVAAILGGGLEIRTRAGIPPFGRVDHRPFEGTIFTGTVGGPIHSPNILSRRDLLERIERAADGIDRVRSNPTVEELFRQSESFTDRVGLAPPPLRVLLRALRRRGAWAAQAMFGRTYFARPRSSAARRELLRWLMSAGVHAVELPASAYGAYARWANARPPGTRPA